MVTKEELRGILEQIPTPVAGSPFTLQKVEDVSIPHPFMIGPRHVQIAADQFGGMLGDAALAYADRVGVGCYVRGCHLSYKEHETTRTLFVLLDKAPPRNLNEVSGLASYLSDIKDKAESLGIKGFAFPHKR